ncbi:glycosyltransferase family A protein [Chthonobacter rhizosphaerae]|uniref:glycosyltransferase family A protein n=1 Tax=Chthonobacter rhizosphaerae TaxID=2735553 RepID=UPI0015EFDB5F|nr:glycosyltransferase family A protein [Chthonobacter rhizosphaerae]
MVIGDGTYPLVAVVTPVRNGAPHLAETLESVQAQDYPSLLHVLLDNASTDETAGILKAFGKRAVPLAVWRNREPLSRPANWETAIHQIPPETAYFRLLAAGDRMRPDAISRMVAVAEASPNVGAVGALAAGSGGSVPDYRLLPTDRAVFSGHDIAAGLFRDEVYPVWVRHVLVRATLLHHRAPYYAQHLEHLDLDSFFSLMCVSDFGFVHEVLGWDRALLTKPRPDVYDPDLAPEWMQALNRYGPVCFTPDEFDAVLQRFYRRYTDALLTWRYTGRIDAEVFRMHVEGLAERGHAPTFGRTVAAMLKAVPRSLRLRRSRTGGKKRLRIDRTPHTAQTDPAGA